MPNFIPKLSNVVEFPFGEHPRLEEGEMPLHWLVTFFRPSVSVTASALGLYFKRIVGDVTNLDVRANIIVYEQIGWTIEPETPAPVWNPVTIASDVDLKSFLAPPAGWKIIPIDTFTFHADRTYTIMFDMVSRPSFINGQIDEIIVSAAEQFDIPLIPPTWPGSKRQAKNAFGFERVKTGFIYTHPVAVAAYGEDVTPPAPLVESGIITDVNAPVEAFEGERLPITATIQNTGEVQTTFSTFIGGPGHIVNNINTLNPGESIQVFTDKIKMSNKDIEITVSLYHADVLDDTKKVIVKFKEFAPPPEPPPVPPPVPPPAPPQVQMGGGIGLAVAAGGATLMEILRRRMKK